MLVCGSMLLTRAIYLWAQSLSHLERTCGAFLDVGARFSLVRNQARPFTCTDCVFAVSEARHRGEHGGKVPQGKERLGPVHKLRNAFQGRRWVNLEKCLVAHAFLRPTQAALRNAFQPSSSSISRSSMLCRKAPRFRRRCSVHLLLQGFSGVRKSPDLFVNKNERI